MDKVLMIKPLHFGFCEETSETNFFQRWAENTYSPRQSALRESLALSSILKANGIEVVSAEDIPGVHTPLAMFPASWFSVEDDGTLVIYPVCCPVRRGERKGEFIDIIKTAVDVKRVIDLSFWEEECEYLEGAGSLVFDRKARMVFACRSPRTSEKVVADFCKKLGFSYMMFDAVDGGGRPIYHTDVVMAVTSASAAVCTAAISSPEDASRVKSLLESSGHRIVELTMEQMAHFAANVTELENKVGSRFIVMSGGARKSLTPEQVRVLGAGCRILSPALDTIETIGGASVHQMVVKIG